MRKNPNFHQCSPFPLLLTSQLSTSLSKTFIPDLQFCFLCKTLLFGSLHVHHAYLLFRDWDSTFPFRCHPCFYSKTFFFLYPGTIFMTVSSVLSNLSLPFCVFHTFSGSHLALVNKFHCTLFSSHLDFPPVLKGWLLNPFWNIFHFTSPVSPSHKFVLFVWFSYFFLCSLFSFSISSIGPHI